MKKFAIILCGSGYRDGSEIRESVACLWALSTFGVDHQCFAPDAPQSDVINCLTNETMLEVRNQLVESARIARGRVKPLNELRVSAFSGLLMPGGFGAAKNLCNFANNGAEGEVIPELQAIITEFWSAKKPIGAICIAPAIVGLALKGKGLELSVGRTGSASVEIEKMGHRHIETKANECHVDIKNLVVTTPAYMIDDAEISDLFEGVRQCVRSVIEMSPSRGQA